jgi:hypothetical protein
MNLQSAGKHGCALATLLVCLQWTCCVCPVQARRVRPMFEPTDIALEEPGTLALELQLGVARADDAGRLVIPDFELDLALWSFLELDIDGAYAIAGSQARPFAFSHAAPDTLWVAVKSGLLDLHDDADDRALALGAQLGPKLPMPTTHGVGFEGLVLVGTALGPLHLVWNAGGFIDSAVVGTAGRPVGIELGVDAELGLSANGSTKLIASASYVHFLSADSDQLLFTAGVSWAPVEALELSLLALVGVLSGGDRYGLLLGVSPKIRLFDGA